MTLRRILLVLASLALSVVLVALLIHIGGIDVRSVLQQLQRVSLFAFTKLVVLNVLLIGLSTAKWRSIDAVLRRSSDSVPSRTTSFAITSAGMALGLVLPVQLGMTAARTLGTWVHGRALKRGTAGTLLEQSFDVLIVAFLAVASVATWFYRGGGLMWTLAAVAMTALALLAVAPSIRLMRWLASRIASNTAPEGSIEPANARGSVVQDLLRKLSDLQHSGLLNAALARRLVMLSALRFAVLVLMSGQTAQAIGAHIPLWQFAAAVPFVVIATVIAITPGGLGVNELTSTTALNLFGTPLTVAAQWALANRVLVVASCFVVAACAITMLGVERVAGSSTRQANPKTEAEGI